MKLRAISPRSARWLLLAACALPSPSWAQPGSPASAPDERDSPRALMRVFLLNAKDLAEAPPEQIDRALACLDLQRYPVDDRREVGIRLASKIEAILDHRGIKLDELPESSAAEHYRYDQALDLRRQPDGTWQFSITERTASWIEQTYDRIQQQQQQQQPEVEPAPAAPGQDDAPPIDSARRSPRATMETFIKAMEQGALDTAISCLDLRDVSATVRSEKGAQYAEDLLFCIERLDKVVYQTIPDDPRAGSPYLWKEHRAGRVALHLVSEGPNKGLWQFTPHTLKGLDQLFEALEDQPPAGGADATTSELSLRRKLRSAIPDSLKGRLLGLQHWQWFGMALLIFVGFLVDRVLSAGLSALLKRQLDRQHVHVARDLTRSTMRPLALLVMAAVWWRGLSLLIDEPEILAWLLGGVKFFAAAVAVWTCYRMVDLLAGYLRARAARTVSRFDDLLVPLIRKSLKVFITLFGVVFVANVMNWDIKSFMAGLGIGGLALAFAARETLGNIFGSLTILLDRPFHIGDWIKIGDKEGTVEAVGFRSTRIRTFYDSVITIPNAECVNTAIDNMGQRRYRRIKTMISVTYDTPVERLETFCEGIRDLIREHPHTRKDSFHVYLNEYAPSSLDILLYCFVETPDWALELKERERLFLDILRLAERLDVELAFPTRTVHLHDAAQPPSET